MAELIAQDLSATAYELIDGGVSDMDTPNIGGDYFAYTGGGDYVIVINNANASDRTVTVVNQAGGSDVTATVNQDDRGLIAGFSGTAFVDEDDRIQLTYDAVTDLTVKVIKTPYGGKHG